jgi:hypothetical protein
MFLSTHKTGIVPLSDITGDAAEKARRTGGEPLTLVQIEALDFAKLTIKEKRIQGLGKKHSERLCKEHKVVLFRGLFDLFVDKDQFLEKVVRKGVVGNNMSKFAEEKLVAYAAEYAGPRDAHRAREAAALKQKELDEAPIREMATHREAFIQYAQAQTDKTRLMPLPVPERANNKPVFTHKLEALVKHKVKAAPKAIEAKRTDKIVPKEGPTKERIIVNHWGACTCKLPAGQQNSFMPAGLDGQKRIVSMCLDCGQKTSQTVIGGAR